METEEKKTEKKSLNSLIIHPAIEPGVIDNAMLIRCILDYGKYNLFSSYVAYSSSDSSFCTVLLMHM